MRLFSWQVMGLHVRKTKFWRGWSLDDVVRAVLMHHGHPPGKRAMPRKSAAAKMRPLLAERSRLQPPSVGIPEREGGRSGHGRARSGGAFALGGGARSEGGKGAAGGLGNVSKSKSSSTIVFDKNEITEGGRGACEKNRHSY
jgi:hypothetical protein